MRSGTCPRTYGEPMSTDYPSSAISSNPMLSALPRYASVFLSQGSDSKLLFPILHMPLKTKAAGGPGRERVWLGEGLPCPILSG